MTHLYKLFIAIIAYPCQELNVWDVNMLCTTPMPSTTAVILINATVPYVEANPARDARDPLTGPIKHPSAESASAYLPSSC